MSTGAVTCPRCPGHLVYDPEGRTTLYTCPNCHGHWNGTFPVDANMKFVAGAPSRSVCKPSASRRWRWPWSRRPTAVAEPVTAAPQARKRVDPYATVARIRKAWTAGGRRAWAEMRVVGNIQHGDGRRYAIMENGEWRRV